MGAFFYKVARSGGQMRHPRDMGAPEVEAFLTMLAHERQASVSTHNQALSTILFLYREVLTSTCLGYKRSTARNKSAAFLLR